MVTNEKMQVKCFHKSSKSSKDGNVFPVLDDVMEVDIKKLLLSYDLLKFLEDVYPSNFRINISI